MTVLTSRYSVVMLRCPHAILCLLAASAAQAQVTAHDLPQIQQGGLDVSPLAYQHIVMPLELEVPNDFETIYQVSGPTGEVQFVRFAGGTAAVFPRSVYLPTSEGILPDIPPDTIFYIDGLPPSYGSPDEVGPAWTSPSLVSYQVTPFAHRAVNMRPAEQAAPVRPAAPASDARPAYSVWISDTHRRKRVSALLHAAADARRD